MLVRAPDLESSEPKLIKISFVSGYPGCHTSYVDLNSLPIAPRNTICLYAFATYYAYTRDIRVSEYFDFSSFKMRYCFYND